MKVNIIKENAVPEGYLFNLNVAGIKTVSDVEECIKQLGIIKSQLDTPANKEQECSVIDRAKDTDKELMVYFGNGIPTSENYPESEWKEEEKHRELNNIYVNRDDGRVYKLRFVGDRYCWIPVTWLKMTDFFK